MKLIIPQEKLKQGLQTIERISVRSTSLPILNNVLLKTEKNFLNLSSTDLEIGIKWWSLAKIEKEGEVAIPISILLNFFSFLPNKQVSLQQKDTHLLVECEHFITEIKGFASDDFPIIPGVAGEFSIEIEAAPFCEGLGQIIDIAASSQTRPEISGIYLSFQKDVLKMAATDSFRLGEKSIFLNKEESSLKNINEQISLIIPQKTAREIVNIFSEKPGKIKILFSSNQILVEKQMQETPHPEVQLISRLIEGDYPAYQDIIPQNYETQIIVQKNEFLNQLKAAAIFCGKINEIKLTIEPKKDGIKISSQSQDLGEYRSFLPGKIKGGHLEISFNHRFLTSGLVNIKGPEVVFELQKEEGPAVLRPLGDNSYLYVVMPIKSS